MKKIIWVDYFSVSMCNPSNYKAVLIILWGDSGLELDDSSATTKEKMD